MRRRLRASWCQSRSRTTPRHGPSTATTPIRPSNWCSRQSQRGLQPKSPSRRPPARGCATLQQIALQQLKDVGITINIKNTSADTFFGQWLVQGQYEMGEWGWTANPDPTSTTLFSANQVPPKGQNYYRYKNQEVTRLWEESDKTVDENKRADMIRQAQDLMVEDMPLIPLYQWPVIY